MRIHKNPTTFDFQFFAVYAFVVQVKQLTMGNRVPKEPAPESSSKEANGFPIPTSLDFNTVDMSNEEAIATHMRECTTTLFARAHMDMCYARTRAQCFPPSLYIVRDGGQVVVPNRR